MVTINDVTSGDIELALKIICSMFKPIVTQERLTLQITQDFKRIIHTITYSDLGDITVE